MTTKKVILAFTFLLSLSVTAFAQKNKVSTVVFKLSNTVGDARTGEAWHNTLDECVKDIEDAAKHTTTAADPRMFYYRGFTYLTVLSEGSDEQKAKYKDKLYTAVESFKKCIELDAKGKHTKDAKKGLVDCAVRLYNEGVMTYNNKEFAKSLKAYETALDLFQYDDEKLLQKNAGISKEMVMLNAAAAANRGGDVAKAKSTLKQLAESNYKDANVYYTLHEIYLNEKDTTKALETLALGREALPEDKNLINAELDLMLKLGRSKELMDKLDNAIAAQPNDPILHYARGLNYFNLYEIDKKIANLDEAEKSYQKAIELDPGYFNAYFNLGVVYTEKCKPIKEKIDAEKNYDKQLVLESQIDELYKKAAVPFEECMNMADGNMTNAEKADLAQNLKIIYGRLQNVDKSYEPKYKQMRALIDELKG